MNKPLQNQNEAAYVGMGIRAALSYRTSRNPFHAIGCESEMDFVDMVMARAHLLDFVWDEAGEDWSGVWMYDVVEEFGEQYATHLLDGEEDSDAAALALIRQLVDEANV